MIKGLKLLSCLPLLLAITACSDSNNNSGDGGDGTPPPDDKPTVGSLEASGQIPKLDRSDDLLGPDTDNNDIRDDIDQYIATHFTTSSEVSAAQQAAKATQRVLTPNLASDDTNGTKARQVNQEISRATACIYSVFGEQGSSTEPAAASEELEAITFNTAARLKAYMDFAKALDGTSWSLPEGNSCE